MSDLASPVELDLEDEASVQSTLRTLGVRLRFEEVRKLLDLLGRQPTAAELALLNSMWSEHCSYKSTRTLLARLPTRAPHVVVGPGADAGVVRLPRVGADGRAHLGDAGPGASGRCICIGHESHNHPSQLLPHEGAATGIGGIVRDVYCMGADVIGVLDALRFGDPNGDQADSVRQIVRGVVDGVAHYGNALGVPNLGGDVEFDADFDDNCLVNVVAVGILDEDEIVPSVAPRAATEEPYVLVLVGKPTDDSGLGGAAFASATLDTDEATQERGAVQLPDPFFKRVLTEANKVAFRRLRQHGAPFAVKDLGAAGLGGAASEMAAGAGLGLDLDLDAVHRDADRAAAVLLVAETQERYALAVPETIASEICSIYESDFELGHMVRGAGARVIGRFRAEPRFRASQAGVVHVDLPASLITEALRVDWPRAPRPVQESVPVADRDAEDRQLKDDVETLLASPALASRHGIYAHYDSDVQGRTMLRPGDGDAGVLVPRRDEPIGIAVGIGGAARWGRRDARRAGLAALCEAVRNVVACGATPWALTDCLNHGSPETAHGMQDLVDVVEGLAEAARGLGLRHAPEIPLPFVSGNVSLYNESLAGRAIPPMPIVACLGVLCDYSRARGTRFVFADDVVYRLATPSTALGNSLYARLTASVPASLDPLPPLDLQAERARMLAVLEAFDAGIVQACHDIGDGGTLVALLEMCFGREARPDLGVDCRPPVGSRSRAALFSETSGYVCEVREEDAADFESICRRHDVEPEVWGRTLPDPVVRWETADGLEEAWPLGPLAEKWARGLRGVLRGRHEA